ncbi:MAG TPA: peptidoglycan-binding protein, partial [Solirubrobacteraceae bacterium]|nr:peptidoglycan-binding protein [Solirubrobacteraceae bacterium]
MSGIPRDLAVADPWVASLERSRARRERAGTRRSTAAPARPGAGSRASTRLASLVDARKRLPSPRNLSEDEPWDLSSLRSRTRRRAAELQFVPSSTRARRISLGTLVALAAGPAVGLADSGGSSHHASSSPPPPEPPTTAEHHINLQVGSEGRQVRILQHKLGIAMDGVYGPQTEAAVRAFQQREGLPVDGTVSQQTSAALSGHPASVAAPPSLLSTSTHGQAEKSGNEAASQSGGSGALVAGTGGTQASSAADSASAHEVASAAAPSHKAPAPKPAVDPIVQLQEKLGVSVDGTYGPETERAVKHLQAVNHLHVDGVVGSSTWSVLKVHDSAVLHPEKLQAPKHKSDPAAHEHSASAPTHSHSQSPVSGADAVRRLQEALGVEADGNYGPQTESAVKHFQSAHGLEVDGVVGPATWGALGIDSHTTLHPHHAHHSSGGGSSTSSSGGSGVIARVIAAADEIATRPYTWGGGHGSFQSVGYDCSGSVSYALHGGGLLSSPEDSSELESYGEAGPGRYITIYADAEHAWMVIDGRRFDT